MQQRGVTKRQKELLRLIYISLKDNGYPPSFEELKEKLGITSNQAIIDHLISLERKDLIEREEKSARGIKIKPLGYKTLGLNPLAPFLGASAAGTFTEAFQINGAYQTLSDEVQKLDHEVYIIKVSGDSMINVGINNGDHLLVKNQAEFSSGDIVVAQSPDGTTVKRFVRQNKPPFIYLKPENPKYNLIMFTDEMSMQGKIIGKLNNNEWQPLAQGRFI